MTIRLRLTLVYGALFLVAGVVLLSLSYALVSRQLPHQIELAPSEVGDPPPFEDQILLEPGPEDVERIEALAEELRRRTMRELLTQSALALGITTAAAFGLGWVVAGRVLRPVHDITAAARRLSEHNLHERLALDGPQDELKELADTFDAMLDRLEAAFDGQRRFVANASHELRTPLSIMRAQLEVPGHDPAQLLSVIDRSEHVVDGLLLLARSARQPSEVLPVDLADVASVALAELEPPVGEVALAPAVVEGDGGLLEHVALNLVTNALVHGSGGVDVRTGVEDGWAVLEVANGGPVIDPDAVATLVEPFRRGVRERTGADRGAGLGLSIVDAVTEAHGGSLSLAPRAGGGLRATVRLPLASGRDGARATARARGDLALRRP